jgi:signal transduction histidine kinase
MTESGQLDLVDVLDEQVAGAYETVVTIAEMLNPQIDANPNDKLLMEMFDVATDAQESLDDLRTLLQTMRKRDLAELP